MIRVEDLYKESHKQSEPLLSNYEGDWWEVYVNNYEYFDRLFMKTYRSFIPFNAFGDSIEAVTVDFTQDCFNWLLMNDKRYSELYRMQLVDDDEYNFLFNYDMKEVYTGSSSKEESETLGSRTDTRSGSTTYGETSESVNKSDSFATREDTHEVEKSIGHAHVEDEQKTSAFNSSSYQEKDLFIHDEDAKTDEQTVTDTYGSHTDTGSETRTSEEHTDETSGADTKGEQTNESESLTTDGHTLTRQGNVGVETTSDIMEKHVNLWAAFSFYKIVFDDIANEFLRVE